MHSTSILGLLKEFGGQNLQYPSLRLWLMPSAEGLIFQNENLGFGLMSKNTVLVIHCSNLKRVPALHGF